MRSTALIGFLSRSSGSPNNPNSCIASGIFPQKPQLKGHASSLCLVPVSLLHSWQSRVNKTIYSSHDSNLDPALLNVWTNRTGTDQKATPWRRLFHGLVMHFLFGMLEVLTHTHSPLYFDFFLHFVLLFFLHFFSKTPIFVFFVTISSFKQRCV